MARQIYLGSRVRRLREERGWTQTSLATRLGISGSYLNLIEHNKRAVTVPLLLRLAELFQLDVARLAESDDSGLVPELEEAFADACFSEQPVSRDDVQHLARHIPSAARAVLGLYRSFRALRKDAEARSAQDSDRSALADEQQPPDEVAEMIHSHRHHFAVLEAAAERVWREANLLPGNLEQGLVEWLQRRHSVQVEIVPFEASADAVRVFDPERRRLRVSEVLPQPSRTFQLAHQLALLSLGNELEALMQPQRLTSDTARALARVALANYFAGAVIMPYQRCLEAAQQARYDIEILQQRFGASFEQVCHRLTTLNRPNASGVPLHFVRIDIAGNISKRYSGSGIRFARYSGACPRWNVHTAFLTPGRIQTQVSRMPDGTTYFCIARTVRKAGGGHHVPQSHLAVGLGCLIEFASELVYADGIQLDTPAAVVPIGVSCRICERTDCRQRAFPPIHHRLDIDPNRRGLSFYCTPRRSPGG